jgi:hypothetical protein
MGMNQALCLDSLFKILESNHGFCDKLFFV